MSLLKNLVIALIALSVTPVAYADGYKKNAAAKAAKINADIIRSVQKELDARGYEVSVDGHFGTQTKKALREFQSANNLMVTGQINQATLISLGVSEGREPASLPEAGPGTHDSSDLSSPETDPTAPDVDGTPGA